MTRAISEFSRLFRWPLHAAFALLLASPLHAQMRVSVEENIRATPNGVLLGQLVPGTLVEVVRSDGDWRSIDVEGWVWTRSLRTVDRDGFDLVVSVEGGENLRAAPSGDILGRLEDGALLNEIERVPGWVRIRRTVWIWAESLASVGEEGSDPSPAGAVPRTRFRVAPSTGMAVLAAPDGDTLARAAPGADVEVLAREGNWARVRMEGWAWMPEDTPTDRVDATEAAPVTPAEVAASPEGFRGRLVEWDLQFVSLERAEKVRTDFYEGEPFLLTRTSEGGGSLFVYVALPPEQVGEMRSLTALEMIRVVGRVRVGSASLTGSPIIDLLELTTGRKP